MNEADSLDGTCLVRPVESRPASTRWDQRTERAADSHDERVNVARLVLDYVKALAWPAIVVIVMIFFREEFRRLLRRLKSAKGAGASVEFSEEAQAVAEEARAVVEAEVRETRERVQEVRSAFEAGEQAVRAAAEAETERGTPGASDPHAGQRSLRAEQMAQQGIALVNAMQSELEQLLDSVLPSPAAPMSALRSMAREHPEAAIMAAYREVEMRLEVLVRKVVGAARARGEAIERPRIPQRKMALLIDAGLSADIANLIMGLSRLRNEVTHGGAVQSSAIDYISACAAVLNLLSLFERRHLPPEEGQLSPAL